MFSTLRTRFGIPGVISVMALVFAMFGGAYAASNSSNGGKATASAKAKKGPRGPKGATGPAGPQGLAGANGKDGANGSNGASGAQGKSVVVGTATGVQCLTGGKTLEVEGSGVKTPVCNGKNGENGKTGFTETLPSEMTETGTYVVSTETGTGDAFGLVFAPISFAIPLEKSLDAANAIYVPKNKSDVNCTGSISNPTAPSGFLCVYESLGEKFTVCEVAGVNLGAVETTGALVACTPDKTSPGGGEQLNPGYAVGAWAVTAPAVAAP